MLIEQIAMVVTALVALGEFALKLYDRRMARQKPPNESSPSKVILPPGVKPNPGDSSEGGRRALPP